MKTTTYELLSAAGSVVRYTDSLKEARRAVDADEVNSFRPMVEIRGAEQTAGPYPLKMDAGRTPGMSVIVNNQGNHYATTYDPSAARLILAGPEMLAALKLAEDYLRNHCFRTGTGTKEDRAFAAAAAAIARAEGR